VFISYAREDRSRVEPLVRILEAQGYSVWWDRELVPGASFEKVIDKAITDARCVIVVWSQGSVDSEWVQAEAGDGLERGILVPVMVDAVRVPISFRRKHAAQLLEWPKRQDKHEIEFLLRGVARCIDGLEAAELQAPFINARPELRRRVPVTAVTLVSAAFVMLLIAGVYFFYPIASPPTANSDTGVADYSIAVIPFRSPENAEVNLTAETQAQSEIAYEISQSLRHIKDLKVTSDETVLGMLAEGDVDDIRRKLAVNFLIEGTLPGQIITDPITVSLVNTLNGTILWTQVFEPEELSAIVGSVVTRVARSLELPVSEGEAGERIPERAYLAYLKGRAELRKPHTERARAAARIQFEKAVAQAPQFGEAYAGLCQARIRDYEVTAAPDDFEAAEQYCHRALTLDLNNHQVHIALGFLFRYSGQYERALDNYRAVLADASFNADALRGMGLSYWGMGLADKAEQQFKLLIEIEPGFWENYQTLGNFYFDTGRFSDAATNYEIQSNLVREKASALNNLAAAYYLAEQFDRAVDAWEKAVVDEPSPLTYANLASAHFFLENFTASAEKNELAIKLTPDDHRIWGNAAEAYYFGEANDYTLYYDKAIELADAQLVINPSDHATLSRIATYHSALGHADDALASLSKARALNDDVSVTYDAAVVYSRLELSAEAEAALDELIALGYSKRLILMDVNFRNFTHVLDKEEL